MIHYISTTQLKEISNVMSRGFHTLQMEELMVRNHVQNTFAHMYVCLTKKT